jgi:uncharacterized protein (TIGR03118 family)
VHARRTVAALAALTTIGLVGSAQAAYGAPGSGDNSGPGSGTRVVQTNIVSDIPGMAALTDPLLVNPWGMSFLPTSPLWTSNQGTGTATLFSGAPPATPPAIVPLVVTIPGGNPTGQVANATGSTTAFPVTGSLGTGTARFIFATLEGTITAWTPAAEATDAVTVATTPGASYTGLTLISTPNGPELLAANFAQGRIDVFDGNFTRLNTPGRFRGTNMPKGFSPFNVQAIGDHVYVAYAKVDPATGRSVDGRGLGFVNRFTLDGTHRTQIAARGELNAPWGLAQVPAGFGTLTGKLLIGNFGDGRIGVYDPNRQHFFGFLRGENGRPVQIERLWALLPGTATTGGTDAIWFSAGIGNETHGLVGTFKAAGGSASGSGLVTNPQDAH